MKSYILIKVIETENLNQKNISDAKPGCFNLCFNYLIINQTCTGELLKQLEGYKDPKYKKSNLPLCSKCL